MSDKKTQIEKFREAAKELGIDVSDAAYDAAVTKVAKAPKMTDDEIKDFARRQRKNSDPANR